MRLFVSVSIALTAASPLAAQLQPTISPQVRVDPGSGIFAANETSGISNPLNSDVTVVGWNDWRLSPTISSEVINAGFALTLDGGSTWSDFLVRPPLANQSGVEGDPFTAGDPRTGALWAGAISFTAGSNSGIYVARLDPGESSFEPSVMARTTSGTDKPWMAAGPRPGLPNTTRCYITYNEGVIYSDNLGDSWTFPQSLGFGIGFLPRVGPNGELYVGYWDLGNQLRVARSLDGGSSFTDHLIAVRMDTWSTQDGSRFPGTFRVPAFTSMAVDPVSGTLYAVYTDTTSFAGGNWETDLYFTSSTDLGTSWAPPVAVINAPGDQFFAWIECDEDGRLHLVYADGRNIPANDGATNGWFDVYYAFSVNGGANWVEHRLTPTTFNSNNDGLDRSSQFLGDYFGIGVSGDVVTPVYIDTSAGNPDTFTHRIELPEPGDIDGDGSVNFNDLVDLLAAWGPCPSVPCAADVNGDGVIDFNDIVFVLASWS